MTFIVTHLINGSAFHVDSQLTPPRGTKTSWSQLQVLRSHSIFITTRYSRDNSQDTQTHINLLSWSRRNHVRNMRRRQLMALLWGSCWLRLCSRQPRLVEAAWLGPEASTVNCTDHVMRLMSDIYQTWNVQSHRLTIRLRASSIHHPTSVDKGQNSTYIRKASGSPLFIAFNKKTTTCPKKNLNHVPLLNLHSSSLSNST